MTEQEKAPVQIASNGVYAIRGKTILDILDSLKATIPCAFYPSVAVVENLLAQVQPINLAPSPVSTPTNQPDLSRAAPSYSVPLEVMEGGVR